MYAAYRPCATRSFLLGSCGPTKAQTAALVTYGPFSYPPAKTGYALYYPSYAVEACSNGTFCAAVVQNITVAL
eukprot:3690168-Pleurochrysis_carterae.AAC.1